MDSLSKNSVRIRFEPDATFVLAIAEGEYSMGGVMTAFQDAVLECVRQERSNLVIDVRAIQGRISIMDRFDFGENMAQALLKFNLRLAMYCRPDQVTPEGFLQSVMANRGARVRVETDMQPIREWLESASPPRT
jgi:hypothetical protein